MTQRSPPGFQVRGLGVWLCWAVVYADIGTSIYYVPGVLSREVGASAASFVLATSFAFLFLASKYTEIAARYPDGGGVVSVATDAFGARAGAVGGMLILVDYFLTAAISSVSGFTYLASLLPWLGGAEMLLAALGLALLGVLNWVGIRESAVASSVVGVAALLLLLALAGVTAFQLDASQWAGVGDALGSAGSIPLADAVTGYAVAWLAFSGLESMAQISPAMREPRARTAGFAMALVGVTILATSPLLTAFGTTLLDPARTNPDALQSELAFAMGGPWLRVGVVVTASALLLFAANTAIVGTYHVVQALAHGGFLPRALLQRSERFGTPGRGIALAVLVPIVVLLGTQGHIGTLADLYAFGLLGAFVLASLALDRVRIGEGRSGVGFAVGVTTTLLVVLAWFTNLVQKPYATLFGGSLTLVMLVYGLVQRGDVRLRLRPTPTLRPEEAERVAAATPAAARLLTLDEALEVASVYRPRTLVCLRGPNPRLLEEVAVHLRGRDERDVALLYVDEIPGLFVPRDIEPTRDARSVLDQAVEWFEQQGVTALPVWRLASDAGLAIAGVAARLGVEAVFVGTSTRGALWRILRGNVVGRLVARAPATTRIVIVG
jgi:amino acid transporter/nucleotide-binding universal stress UspA family protein